MKRLAVFGILCVAALAGCGGDTTTVTVAPPEARTDATATVSEPPAEPSEAVLREWPSRWCRVAIGDSRERVAQIMGSAPTKADSNMLAHIPPIGSSSGKSGGQAGGRATTSDTWAVRTPDLVLFNAFFDSAMRVQQLDFSGPSSSLPCATTRTH